MTQLTVKNIAGQKLPKRTLGISCGMEKFADFRGD
jgi:hypothetical protein